MDKVDVGTGRELGDGVAVEAAIPEDIAMFLTERSVVHGCVHVLVGF